MNVEKQKPIIRDILQLPNPKKSIANFIQYQEFKKIFIFADFLHAK